MTHLLKYLVQSMVLVMAAYLASCAPQKVELPKTQLQMREFQTRSYTSKDVKMVMKAVLNALQDEGYIIKSADKDLGFISASKDVDIEDKTQAFIARLFAGGEAPYQKNAILDVSANVSEFGTETKVRVVFQTKTVDNFGSPLTAAQVDDTKFYQDFFTKVDKSLYFEKERI